MKTYPSHLNKRQRQFIKPYLFKRGNKHRLKWKWKTILNAIAYVLKTGCQWRSLPINFPPWRTVYGYFRELCKQGVWEKINDALRLKLRFLENRKPQPSAVVFDTQSAKAVHGGEDCGFDGYKRVKGRKRFLLVDTMGLLMSVKVVAANTCETKAAMLGLESLSEACDGVQIAWADQGFGGEPFRKWLEETHGWELELTRGLSKPGKEDYVVAPRRWVVERTIAWLCQNRRLLCDFERLVLVSTNWVYMAMVILMAKRLAKLSC
jgi:putative transposase